MLKTKINLIVALVLLAIVGVAVGIYQFAVTLFSAAAVTSVCILFYFVVLLVNVIVALWRWLKRRITEWQNARALYAL